MYSQKTSVAAKRKRERSLNKVGTILNREQLYDRLYKSAEFLIKKHNPCGVSSGKCMGSANFCCRNCKHLTKNGCGTNALYCKVWLCPGTGYSVVTEQLASLCTLASHYGLLKVRGSKKETLDNNHIGVW